MINKYLHRPEKKDYFIVILLRWFLTLAPPPVLYTQLYTNTILYTFRDNLHGGIWRARFMLEEISVL